MEIREAIPKGLALFQYFVLPERLLIWRFHAGETRLWEVSVDRERLQERLESFVRELQAGRDSGASPVLYDLLLRGPLEGLPPATELIFVPDRSLNSLPFAALRDRQTSRYLIENHPLGYALSASRFLADLDRKSGRDSVPASITTLGFGKPKFSESAGVRLNRLPFTESEAVDIANIYSKRRVLLGRLATRSAFVRALGESEVVHFAGHGIFNSEAPLNSGIVLAGAESSEDGMVLTARNIPDLSDSRLRLLVLSACNTSAGDGRRVEGMTGIAEILLARGVPAVLSSQWEVNDSVTKELFVNFHHNLTEGLFGRRSLQLAQVLLLRESNASVKHWASYRVTGEI
ncbi:MAG TPA: CHAT domain-containing protein [Thermoanaerobaculia bacterium]|nr:CHAT domain-containing protein [Thermoanaerobaculia bacterium]